MSSYRHIADTYADKYRVSTYHVLNEETQQWSIVKEYQIRDDDFEDEFCRQICELDLAVEVDTYTYTTTEPLPDQTHCVLFDHIKVKSSEMLMLLVLKSLRALSERTSPHRNIHPLTCWYNTKTQQVLFTEPMTATERQYVSSVAAPYMPEDINNPNIDQFSLACVLYKVATGCHISRRQNHTPKWFERVVKKMLKGEADLDFLIDLVKQYRIATRSILFLNA